MLNYKFMHISHPLIATKQTYTQTDRERERERERKKGSKKEKGGERGRADKHKSVHTPRTERHTHQVNSNETPL